MPTFERRLCALAAVMDFGRVSAALAVERPGRESLFRMIGNTPAEFLQDSRDPDQCRRDPVMQRMIRLSTPFAYDRATYAEAGADDLWETQARYGYKTGIAVALHMQAGRHFLLGFDRDAALPSSDDGLIRVLADLQLVAVFAQDAASRLLGAWDQGEKPQLTEREHEALLWAAQGKTAEETGLIIGLSKRGVEYHLHNVMRKLDAPNKIAAVKAAIDRGLIPHW
ncbi:MAG: autoinducer binding domain-containing protein [Rubrivivax sp.]